MCVSPTAVHVHDMSVFVVKILHDSLSLSLSLSAPVELCRSPFPSLCLYLYKYSILFLSPPFPASSLCLPSSINPLFPLHQFCLASVKPLKKSVYACVSVSVCMCWSCCVGFEQALVCSAPVAYEMRKAATVLQTSADKSTRVTPRCEHLHGRPCAYVCQMHVFAYV